MPICEAARYVRAGRHAGLLALLLAATALSGCMQTGASSVDAELARVRAIKGVGVVSADPQRAVIAARGQRVVVAPAQGSCIAPQSVEASSRFAFMVVSDCTLEEESEVASAGETAEILLPTAFPGVVTVSVSADPMDEEAPTATEAVERLKTYLQTPAGLAQLGRGDEDSAVRVLEMRTVGDTLYVLVDDGEPTAAPILSDRFWRAFAEVNGRLVLTTVSGFRERPMNDEEMLRKLVAQVVALRAANGEDHLAAAAREFPAALPPERGVSGPPSKRAPYSSPDAEPAPHSANVAERVKRAKPAPAAPSAAPVRSPALPSRPEAGV